MSNRAAPSLANFLAKVYGKSNNLNAKGLFHYWYSYCDVDGQISFVWLG